MKRSKRVIFVSFCILAQGFRAEGIVKKFPAVVKPILELLAKRDVNIVQMPCPEIRFEGIRRRPAGKSRYDTVEYRQLCRGIADEVASFIRDMIDEGYEVLGILGVENSPSCGVNYVIERRWRVKGRGVFMEELEGVLREKGLDVPLIGLDIYRVEKTLAELEELLDKSKIADLSRYLEE